MILDLRRPILKESQMMTLVLCFSEIGKSHMDLIYISDFPPDTCNATHTSYVKSDIHI